MKKHVVRYGLLSGLIVSIGLVTGIAWCYSKGNFEGNMILGFTFMFLAFSMVFLGVKHYRNHDLQGSINFTQALKLGTAIAFVASTIYVVVWLIDYYLFIPDFMDKYSAHSIARIQSSGADAAEIATKIEEIKTMKEMYNTPFMVVLMTYMEIFPVGFVIAIISALILKRKVAQ